MSDTIQTDLQNLNLAIAEINRELTCLEVSSQALLTELFILRCIREKLSVKIALSELTNRSLKSAVSEHQQSARETEVANVIGGITIERKSIK